jgi:hypothetical protein
MTIQKEIIEYFEKCGLNLEMFDIGKFIWYIKKYGMIECPISFGATCPDHSGPIGVLCVDCNHIRSPNWLFRHTRCIKGHPIIKYQKVIEKLIIKNNKNARIVGDSYI